MSAKPKEQRRFYDRNLEILTGQNEKLGSGTFGSVYRGYYRSPTGQELPCAVKVFNGRSMQENKELEGSILQLLEHPNIVRVYQIGNHDREGYYIAMELCECTLKGFLQKHGIKKFTEREARSFFVEICKGVRYLQEKNIIHRDLKFENILIDVKNDLKIADFGLAKLIDEFSLTMTTCGSTHIMAPEIFKRQPYGIASDVWSLGIILYGMLTGDECIYRNVNRYEYEEKIKRFKAITFAEEFEVTSQAKDLISQILNPDPLKRLTIEQVLAHTWMQQPNDEDLLASRVYLNNYSGNVAPEKQFCSQLATLVAKDITTALDKSVNFIFSLILKVSDSISIFKSVKTDKLNFDEAYYYSCIRILMMLVKLENLEFNGPNGIFSKVSVLKFFEGSRKSLFSELRIKFLAEVTAMTAKLEARERSLKDFDEVCMSRLLSAIEAFTSSDLDNSFEDKRELKKLYSACRNVMNLIPKDFDQYVTELKFHNNRVAVFALKHKLDPDSFLARVVASVNQIKIGFDISESLDDKAISAELKQLYEVSFNPYSRKKTLYEQYEAIIKSVDSKLEHRIKEIK